MRSTLIIPVSFAVLLSACGGQRQNEAKKEEPKKEEAKIVIPDFNADSAFLFVKQQVDFGPRVPNTPAHQKCSQFLYRKMKAYIPDVTIQSGQIRAYNGTLLDFKNIIGSVNPDASVRVMLCSHWDSRPYADHDPDPKNRRTPIDGANDGASGVGTLLEVARQLQAKAPSIGVDIILFDVEDYGPPQDERGDEDTEKWWGLGSQYWAANPHKPDYNARFGILLDMTGASKATFLMEAFSVQYAPDVLKLVWDAGNRIGYSSFFIYERGPYITDDHLPINKIRNIPTIDIVHLDASTSSGFYPYWHTTGDILSRIDPYTLKAVGQTLLAVIYDQK